MKNRNHLLAVAIVLHVLSIGLVVAGALLRGRMYITLVLAALMLTVVGRSIAERARR